MLLGRGIQLFLNVLRTAAAVIAVILSVQAASADENAARGLLVEAIRAYGEASDATTVQARLEALERAAAALDTIEADHAITDTGIALISGDQFGAFDPQAVRTDLELARSEASSAQCAATFSLSCVIQIAFEADAEMRGVDVADIEANLSLGEEVIWAALRDEGIPEEFVSGQAVSFDQFFDVFRILVSNGRTDRALSLFERLPQDHPILAETSIESMQDFMSFFAEVIGADQRSSSAALLRAADVLIAEAPPGYEIAVANMGSQEQVTAVISGLAEPADTVSEWFFNDLLPTGQLPSAFVAVALDASGNSDLAEVLALDAASVSNWFSRMHLVRNLNPELQSRFLSQALSQFDDPNDLRSTWWMAAGYVPIDTLAEISGALDGVASGDRYFPDQALEAGMEAGRQGLSEYLVFVTGSEQSWITDSERQLFENGYAVGQLLSSSPSSQLFDTIWVTGDDERRASLMRLGVEESVRQGRHEQALQGFEGSGLLSRVGEGFPGLFETAAYLGNLERAAIAYREGVISGIEINDIAQAFAVYLDTSMAHDLSVDGAAAQMEILLRELSGDRVFSRTLGTLVLTRETHFHAGGELLYSIADRFEGDERIAVLQTALQAAMAN